VARLREAFAEREKTVVGRKEYYNPDGIQERWLSTTGIVHSVDFALAMAYDMSIDTLSLAKKAVDNWKGLGLGVKKLVLGIPLYGRHGVTGEAKSHADLVLNEYSDEFKAPTQELTLAKVQLAREGGLGGVMFWELGQDFPPSDPRALLRFELSIFCVATQIHLEREA